MDILEQIRTQYDSFSKTRQRICDRILSEPEQCCFCSLKRFAQQVGTTEATVLSFCRSLGLGSYLELKKALQDYLVRKVNPSKRLRLAVSASDSMQDLCTRVVRAERDALQTTFDSNSTEELLAFVRLLQQAKRIYIVAHNLSRIPASYLHHRLLTLGVDSCILDIQNPSGLFTRLSQAPESGLLIAIAIPPYGDETLALTRYCAAIGMPVAAITDRTDSPLCQNAQVSLLCHVSLMGMTNSYTPMVGLMDLATMLYSYVQQKGTPAEDPVLLQRRSQFHALFLQQNESN